MKAAVQLVVQTSSEKLSICSDGDRQIRHANWNDSRIFLSCYSPLLVIEQDYRSVYETSV